MRTVVLLLALAGSLLISACGTKLKVAELDSTTGYLTYKGKVAKATVLTGKKGSLARYNSTVFVMQRGEYAANQMKATKLFKTVLNIEDMQKVVVQNNLQEKVATVTEPIALSRLAKSWKPFLWVDFDKVTKENKPYLRMLAYNPENYETLFSADVYVDYVWEGTNDQNVSYPLFNAFIDWVKANP